MIEDDDLDVETTIQQEVEGINSVIPLTEKYPGIPHLDPAKLAPALNPTLVVDGKGLELVRDYLTRVNEFAFDYETNVVPRFFHRRARTIQIGDKNEQYMIDLLAFAGSTDRLVAGQGLYRAERGLVLADGSVLGMSESDQKILAPVVEVIRPALQSNSHLKVGHNLEFEYIVSKWCLGMRPWHFYCTQRAERNITNGSIRAMERDYFGLADLVRRRLRRIIDKSSQTSFDLETPITDIQLVYGALDVRLPLALKGLQLVDIENAKLQWSIQIDMNAIPAFGDLHLNGLLIDSQQWDQIQIDNRESLKKVITQCDEMFIPIVGRKVKWDDEDIARKKAAWDTVDDKSQEESELSTPSPEEADLAEQIRTTPKTKANKQLVDELKERRQVLQALRKDAQAKAKERRLEGRPAIKAAYEEAKKKASAEARKNYASYEGEAAINYGSSAQVLKAFHNAGVGLNANNCRSTDAKKSLIKHMDIPIVAGLVNYKRIQKQLETYGPRWTTPRDVVDLESGKLGFVDPDTGRIHPRHQQWGTDTGRASCTDPNAYNLPRDVRFRKAFISREGYDQVCKDCAGQELRVLVEYTKEPSWVEAFTAGQDVHSISTEILNKPLWDRSAIHQETTLVIDGKTKTFPPCAYFHGNKHKCICPKHKEVREVYKALTLGLIYDKQAFSFSIEMGKPVSVIEPLLFAWKSKFKITDQTLQRLRNSAYDKGEARTLSGRRRIITRVSLEQAKRAATEKYEEAADNFQINKTFESLIASVKREAGNMPIQGSGYDIMALAMGCGEDPDGKKYNWHRAEPEFGALLTNFVYDEFLYESPEENSEAVAAMIEDGIKRAGAELVKTVPMESEGMISKRWQK